MSVAAWKRASVLHPATREDLLRVVEQARENGTSVVVAGGEFPATNGKKDVVLRLRKLRKVLQLDLQMGQVTVQPGISLRELLHHLEAHNLTLPLSGNMPDLTLCDAIAVEVCGSGSGAVGDSVVGVEVLGADGKVAEWDWEQHAEKLAGLLAGLGAVAVLLSATLRCVPLFRIREVSFECPLQDMQRHWHRHLQASESLALVWFPLLDRLLVRQAEPVKLRLARGQPWWKAVLAWAVLQTSRLMRVVSWAMIRLAVVAQKTFPRRWGIRRHVLVGCMQKSHCKWQHRILCLQAQLQTSHCFCAQAFQPVSTYCRGLRWVLPAQSFSTLLLKLLPFAVRHPHLCSTPLHISFISSTDVTVPCSERQQKPTSSTCNRKGLLSPITQESSLMVWTDWFRLPLKGFSAEQAEFEALLQSLGGRKSWASGPLFVSPFLLAQMYPGYRRWCRLRRQLDPSGLFRSAYVRGMLYANPLLT